MELRFLCLKNFFKILIFHQFKIQDIYSSLARLTDYTYLNFNLYISFEYSNMVISFLKSNLIEINIYYNGR